MIGMVDVSWKNIFKLSAFGAASDFCKLVQVGIDVYILHLTHLHYFQGLVLLT